MTAISMKHDRADLGAIDAKTYHLGQQFMTEFAKCNRSSVCEELLGMNIGLPENLAKARVAGLFETKCYRLVKSTAEILDPML